MEKPENNPNRSPEIDLNEVIQSIGRGFNRIGDQLLFVLASLRNSVRDNKKTFIGTMALGILIALLHHFILRKDYYKSTMVINCSYLSNKFIENAVDNLNILADEKEPDGLAEQLQIGNDLADKILQFEFEAFVTEADKIETELLKEKLSNIEVENKELIPELTEKLRFENRNTFKITAVVLDPSIIKELEVAIVKYFTNNEYIKRRIEIEVINLKSRKEKIIDEAKKVDSLKTVVFKNLQEMNRINRGSNNVFLGNEQLTNPLEVISWDLNLHQDILSIDRSLYINPEFEVVDGFITTREPANLGLVASLGIAIVLSFLIAYVIVGILKFNKLLDRYPTR